MCDYIIITNIFTTKACGEVFQIQNGSLNCNSGKVLYFLRLNVCDGTPYVEKSIRLWLKNFKIEHQPFRKRKQNVPQNILHAHYFQERRN